ncbi:hypothetical protein [Campylobacter canadensis]|uniref:hypothetical protein n=1 Tax=Campylobacter canadensis TaxID=449520 RepID=UPI0021E0FF81|nr:hypothetical protein [Campylobacter canadensis]MBZ8004085.1 hypothetical protein [Campylobacter canadensis]
MKTYIVKFFCCFIPSKKIRRKVREKIFSIQITCDEVNKYLPKYVHNFIKDLSNEYFININKNIYGGGA